jgi:hypothetical protein
MYNKVHTKFIQEPLINVLHDGANACRSIPKGIESYPLGEYYLQSLFLKMTGAQEQKMKCICWEMATNNYRYRYEYQRGVYGECSNYKDKKKVYSDIVKNIKEKDDSFDPKVILDFDIDEDVLNEAKLIKANKLIVKQNNIKLAQSKHELTEQQKEKLRNNVFAHSISVDDKLSMYAFVEVMHIVKSSNLYLWDEEGFTFFNENWKDILNKDNIRLTDTNFFSEKMRSHYADIVYSHRNRCAHNLTSYQEDVPPLEILSDSKSKYNNYFFRYSILVLIDEIFRLLFKKYIELMCPYEFGL